MANNMSSKIIKIRILDIKMFNKIVKILTDVWYSFYLYLNFIFLLAIDIICCK